MARILTSTDRPLIETVRATLEANGIAVLVEGDAVTALPFVPMNVLVSDTDATVAKDLIRDLVRPAPLAEGGSRRVCARIALGALVILLLVFCGSLIG